MKRALKLKENSSKGRRLTGGEVGEIQTFILKRPQKYANRRPLQKRPAYSVGKRVRLGKQIEQNYGRDTKVVITGKEKAGANDNEDGLRGVLQGMSRFFTRKLPNKNVYITA